MKNCTFFYKTVKNVAVVLLLLLTVDCRCMFLGVMQHVITKLPFARFLIAAMAKQSAQKQGIVSLKKIGLGAGGLLTAAIVNKKQVKAEHVLYREGKDQNIIPLDENEYNKIAAEVVDQHQWPTAIKNRKYNPDVDETKVIQEKLDQQFPGVKAMWIPDTLFDLVDYAISQKSMVRLFEYQQLSKHFINTEIIHKFSADLQKIETLTWQARTMLFKLMVKKYAQATKEYFQSVRWLSFKDVPSDEIIDKTIDAEAEYKMNHPAKMLFFRGYRENVDFSEYDSFDVAKNQSESDYSKALSGESDLLKIHDYDGAIPLSFGERLLDNIVYDIGACPWYYMKIHNRGFAIPVEKRELMNKSNSFFSLGKDFGSELYLQQRPIFRSGPHCHPRAKAHVSEENSTMQIQDLSEIASQDRKDKRVTLHKTQQEARQGYADYCKYTLDNAIPLTDETADDIQKAKEAWNAAKEGKTFEQFKAEL